MIQNLNIPLGSQHSALLEPIRYSFETKNEKIVGVSYDVGFVHRGIEKACTTKIEYKQVGYVVARVCGLCSITHSLSYTYAIEKILGVEISSRAAFLRILMLELDRIHSHMLCLSHVAENSGFKALFMQTMSERELVMDIQEAICGNRVQFDYVSIGGVNRDVEGDLVDFGLKNLTILEEKIKKLYEIFVQNPTMILKTKNKGRASKELILKYGGLGPIARASGVQTDVRSESAFFDFASIGYKMQLQDGGDVYARNIIRLNEIENSIFMCKNILNNLPDGEIFIKPKGKPKGEAIARLEAPRGEIFYYINANGGNILERVRIKTPTFAQVPLMAEIFKGNDFADAPIILASFDPCLSCTAK